MRKLGILVMAMVMIVGMSGLIFAGEENIAAVNQTGGQLFVAYILQEDISPDGGSGNEARITSEYGKNGDAKIFQFDGKDNYAYIYEHGTKDAVSFVKQYEGENNEAYIWQDRRPDAPYGDWVGSVARINQDGGYDNVASIVQRNYSVDNLAVINQDGGHDNQADIVQK